LVGGSHHFYMVKVSVRNWACQVSWRNVWDTCSGPSVYLLHC